MWCILMFWCVLAHLGAARDKTGRGGGMRPPANYRAKEKLGAQQLGAVQTGENYGCGRSSVNKGNIALVR